jgi:hypothetical protein
MKVTDKLCNKKNNFHISPPWVTFANKMKALFENDDDIVVNDVEDNTGNLTLMIEVKNHSKFQALDQLLSETVKFGNVTLFINIYDVANNDDKPDYFDLFSALFAGNRSVQKVALAEDMTGAQHVFVVFHPEVKQFFDDNMFDYNGFWSGLNQDIAKEVFEDAANAGVHFCTGE